MNAAANTAAAVLASAEADVKKFRKALAKWPDSCYWQDQALWAQQHLDWVRRVHPRPVRLIDGDLGLWQSSDGYWVGKPQPMVAMFIGETPDEALRIAARWDAGAAIALGLSKPLDGMSQRGGIPGWFEVHCHGSQWTGNYGFRSWRSALGQHRPDRRKLRRFCRKLPVAPADSSW